MVESLLATIFVFFSALVGHYPIRSICGPNPLTALSQPLRLWEREPAHSLMPAMMAQADTCLIGRVNYVVFV